MSGGGTVASWLVRSSPDRVVQVQALARNSELCSWARHLTLTVPLATQEYKWVPANCWGSLTNCWGMTCDGLASHPGGVEILLAASCYRNQDKLQQLWASRLQGFTFVHVGLCRRMTGTRNCEREALTPTCRLIDGFVLVATHFRSWDDSFGRLHVQLICSHKPSCTQ